MTHRYIPVFVVILALMTPYAQAAESGGIGGWLKTTKSSESRAPYTVTTPGKDSGLSLPWQKKQAKAKPSSKNITALPREKTDKNENVAVRSIEEMRAIDQKQWTQQAPALEKMLAENQKNAALADKQHAALLAQLEKQVATAKPDPATTTTTPGVKTPQGKPPKSVYLRPDTTTPTKVFPGSL